MGGLLHELLVGLFLDGQGLDGLGPGYSLVEVSRDGGVYLPDLVMQIEEPSLEEGEKHDDHGHHQEYQPGEFHVDAQHYNRSAQHIKRKIRSVEELPGEELTYPRGIAHDPCVDVAHAVLIVVVE